MTAKPEAKARAAAPAGFTQADTALDNYPKWDFGVRPSLAATVKKVKTVTVTRKDEEVDCRLAVVVDPEGELFLLWESANLERFFDDLKPGMQILVNYTGEADLGGSKKMKMFDAFFK